MGNDTANTAKETKTTDSTASDVTALLSLDEYLKTAEVNPGLVASFKAESANDVETARSAEKWAADLIEQSNRIYK